MQEGARDKGLSLKATDKCNFSQTHLSGLQGGLLQIGAQDLPPRQDQK
jgi:hypothetical protein